MKTIGLLCGSRNSGKTKTLKAFFGVSHIKRLKPMQLLERNLNGKKIYAVGLTSPQELANDFCNVEKVKIRIKKRMKKCDRKAQNEDYTLLIPFTMFVKDESINEKCITEPIEWLDSEGHKVFSVHLRKDSEYVYLEDILMKKIKAKAIESKKDNYDSQARELENIIKQT